MRIKKVILNIVLNIINFFVCRQKIKENKIVFITLKSSKLEGDFKLLADALIRKNHLLDIRYILTEFENSIIGNILYFFNCIKQIITINTSKVVIINDNNYIVSNFKRQGVTVVQIWHACGAIKKFGNDVKRQYRIDKYDYVIAPAEIWKASYARSFGIDEERVIPLGVARTDLLYDEKWMQNERERLIKKYPILQNKYVVLYIPTFRGNIIDGVRYEQIDLKEILSKLPSDYVILYRMHPLLKNENFEDSDRIINVAKEDLNGLYSITDCMVSDYSSVLIDFSIMNKKMVLYVPDRYEYETDIGLNVELETIPGTICMNKEDLICALSIKKFSKDKVEQFRRKYAERLDGRSVDRISNFILNFLYK